MKNKITAKLIILNPRQVTAALKAKGPKNTQHCLYAADCNHVFGRLDLH